MNRRPVVWFSTCLVALLAYPGGAAEANVWVFAFASNLDSSPLQTDAASTPPVEISGSGVLEADDDHGRHFMALPFLYYTPETSLAGGAAAMYCWRMGNHLDTRPSDVQVSGTYTLRSQAIAYVNPDIYFDQNRYHVVGRFLFQDYPDQFNGVGNRTPAANEETYNELSFSARLRVERLVFPQTYLGVLAEYQGAQIQDTEDGGLLSNGAAPGSDGGTLVGFGMVASRDTRDNRYYPRNGGYHSLEIENFQPALGSDYRFTELRVESSFFFPVVLNHVLATRLYAEFHFGDVPFYRMAKIGGDDLLRGYYSGRYRDRHAWALQAEYRMPIIWRLGIHVFGGVGDVFETLSDLSFDAIKLAGGAGLRFALNDEGVNLRMDYGFGRGSSGFYFTVGEAF